jgi:hypothetical protein
MRISPGIVLGNVVADDVIVKLVGRTIFKKGIPRAIVVIAVAILNNAVLRAAVNVKPPPS